MRSGAISTLPRPGRLRDFDILPRHFARCDVLLARREVIFAQLLVRRVNRSHVLSEHDRGSKGHDAMMLGPQTLEACHAGARCCCRHSPARAGW